VAPENVDFEEMSLRRSAMQEPASVGQAAVVRALEERVVSRTATVAEEIEFGCCCLEPLHEEERGLACFENALLRDPGSAPARIWIAYCHLHYSMDDDAMRAGRALLVDVIDGAVAGGAEYRGAALLLSAELGDYFCQISKTTVLDLLTRSVAAAPNGVSNRRCLATRYAVLGHRGEADAQLSTAMQNILPEDPSWPVSRKLFERFITGRSAFQVGERLQELLVRLHAEPWAM
jgi:hypothetical protein